MTQGGMLLRGSLYVLVFLLCVAILAKLRSRAVRQPVLLISCYALYFTWGAWCSCVLRTSTVMNFLLGKWLQRKPSGLVLSIGVLLNLALLGSFKYLPEVAVNISLASLQRVSHLPLPLGISFRTGSIDSRSAEPGAPRQLQVPSGSRGQHSPCRVAKVFASRAAPRDLILELPGNELFV